MNILNTETYKEISAENGKLIKDVADNSICRKVVLPARVTDDEINARFVEIDADNFIIKDGQTYSKLEIRRACRALGIETKLNALLEASADFKNDWADAQYVDLTDAVLLEALKAGKFTDEEIKEIKAICNGK